MTILKYFGVWRFKLKYTFSILKNVLSIIYYIYFVILFIYFNVAM